MCGFGLGGAVIWGLCVAPEAACPTVSWGLTWHTCSGNCKCHVMMLGGPDSGGLQGSEFQCPEQGERSPGGVAGGRAQQPWTGLRSGKEVLQQAVSSLTLGTDLQGTSCSQL